MNFNDIELRPVTLRQSSGTCALACERKWFLKYRMGVVLRGGEFHEAADLGSIFHRFMLEGPGSDAEEVVRDWVRGQQVALAKTIEAGGDLDGTLARKANKLAELFDIAKAMANIFWEKFPEPEWFVTIDREIHHECVIEGVTVEGTIDKLLLDTRTGNVWIRDYKSTGRSLDAIFSGIAWGLQGRIYRLLAEDWMMNCYPSSHKNVVGFILDGVTRPGIKLCKKDQANAKEWNCTVAEAYLRRVKEWYSAGEGKKDAKMMRSVATLFTEMRIPFELGRVIDRFRRWTENPHEVHPDYYDRDVTRKECFAWERKCSYYDLCCTDPKQWDQLFATKYKFEVQEESEEDEG